jgi:hypothetical protein
MMMMMMMIMVNDELEKNGEDTLVVYFNDTRLGDV